MCLFLGLVSALEVRQISIAHGLPYDPLIVFASTTPRWIFLAATLPFVLWLAMRIPLTPPRLKIFAMHIAILAVISIGHAAIDTWSFEFEAPGIRHVFATIPRLTRSWYNTLPVVTTAYAAVLFAAWGTTEARERQRRTIRAAQLETQLQAARVTALRAQLQPHFLYNTLNGIAALVSDIQPTRAVAAIEQLGELLHASLREDGRGEITVSEEMALAERYLALQQMRFGARLRYTLDVAAEVADALVPVLLLQPIIENAVVHNLDAGQELLHVHLTATARGDGLAILVENDGREPRRDAAKSGHGVGLAATRARLITAYADRASLAMNPRVNGGAVVRILLPRVSVPAAAQALQGAT